MTNQSDTSGSDLPIEQQGLPTAPVYDDEAGRSFSGDEPDAGADGSSGTKADDADADDADEARAADEEGRAAERAHDSVVDDEPTYASDPTAVDAPPADQEQPIQNPDSPLGRDQV
jgi:hypothetical protein